MVDNISITNKTPFASDSLDWNVRSQVEVIDKVGQRLSSSTKAAMGDVVNITLSFPGNLKCLWGFFEQNRIFLGGSSGENQHMSSCEIFTPGDTKAEDLLKNLQNIPESDADFTFRFVFTLALLLEAENTPIKKSVKQYKAQRILFGQDFVKTITRLYLPEEKEKELATVQVKGFLRNQAYGENWSLHRVIYISPFERIQKINKK